MSPFKFVYKVWQVVEVCDSRVAEPGPFLTRGEDKPEAE